MGMRVRTNVASLKAQRHLTRNADAKQNTMEQLSSGYRINKSADDAAGLAISETLRGKIRSTEQARRNANDGVSLIQVAEGSMNEIGNILVRMRELATQAASDTIGNRERSYTNKEYRQLVNEIDRITNTTEFNGAKLLGGADANDGVGELVFHVGTGTGVDKNTDTISLNIEEVKLNSDVFNLGQESEIGPVDPNGGFSREVAAEKMTTIDNALNHLSGARATLGAKQSRLTSTINNLGVSLENMSITNSRIRDVDFAAATADFTKQRILGQAGASILSQANQDPELALNLLR